MKGIPQPPRLKHSLNRVSRSCLRRPSGYTRVLPTNALLGALVLVTSASGIITLRQIVAFTRTAQRTLKRQGEVFFRLTPRIAITGKPSEIRIGRGKGPIVGWGHPVRAGARVLEFDAPAALHESLARALLKASKKFAVPTRIQYRAYRVSYKARFTPTSILTYWRG